MLCSVRLTLVSGQGALVAVDSMRRKRSQTRATGSWCPLACPARTACRTDAAVHQVSHEEQQASHCDATHALVVGDQEDGLREAAAQRRHG